MNIQDIADFIDLVKNPIKYEQVLQNIKDEQARLNAVIATVGEAAELGNLRKAVELQAATLQESFDKKVDDSDKAYTRKLKKLETLQLDLESKIEQAQKELEVAVVKQRTADELVNSFDGRDKKLKEQEKLVSSLREELKTSVNEYNEKLAKLRAVMV